MERHQQGDWESAAAGYSAILARNPTHAGALRMSGALALQAGQPETAIEILTRAGEVAPRDPVVHFHLGLATQQLGRNDLAQGCYETAVQLRPDYREALENLAVVLGDRGEREAALHICERVLSMAPESELALANAGTLALNLGRDDDALRYFERSLVLYPFNADVQLKRSQVLLRDAQFGAAWDAYEWRFVAGDYLGSNVPVSLHVPHWRGEKDGTGHLVVTAEQGIGDEIMFASCLNDLAVRVPHLTLQCADKLAPLFRRSFPFATLVGRGANLDALDADLRIAIGSLPRYLRRSHDAFGAGDGYLVADAGQVSKWRAWLAGLGGQTVGIAWSGGLDSRARETRSVPLADLARRLVAHGLELVALQYDARAADVAGLPDELKTHIHVPPDLDLWNDLDGVASLLVALDGVVTVDNTLAHLAGALGVPVDVLLPVAAERRWLREQATSPWYRSMRLRRQSAARPGDWAPVLAALQGAPGRERRAEAAGRVMPASGAQPECGRRVLLLNDTASGYHWGCTLTVNGLVQELCALGCAVEGVTVAALRCVPALSDLAATPALLEAPALTAWLAADPDLAPQWQRATAVVVNGEGTLHGTGDQAIALLYALRAVQVALGVPVFIVNHSAYPPTGRTAEEQVARQLYHDVFSAARDVAVREPASRRALAALDINARAAFDCLPLSVPALPGAQRRGLLLGGTAAADATVVRALVQLVDAASAADLPCAYLYGANGAPAADDHQLGSVLAKETAQRLDVRYAATEREWLDAIAGAELLVSGRFHHTIAAACLGTPFGVAGSNTTKIAGLLETLGLEQRFVSWDDLANGRAVSALLESRYAATGTRIEPERLAAIKALGRANLAGVEQWLDTRPDNAARS